MNKTFTMLKKTFLAAIIIVMLLGNHTVVKAANNFSCSNYSITNTSATLTINSDGTYDLTGTTEEINKGAIISASVSGTNPNLNVANAIRGTYKKGANKNQIIFTFSNLKPGQAYDVFAWNHINDTDTNKMRQFIPSCGFVTMVESNTTATPITSSNGTTNSCSTITASNYDRCCDADIGGEGALANSSQCSDYENRVPSTPSTTTTTNPTTPVKAATDNGTNTTNTSNNTSNTNTNTNTGSQTANTQTATPAISNNNKATPAISNNVTTATGNAALNIHLNNPLSGVSTIPDAINKILSIVIRIALPLIIIMFIYSGFRFITARGNPKNLEIAKNIFFYTIIGTMLILGAWTITNAIVGTVNNIIN